MFEKTNEDWDCRAISPEFLAKFCKDGDYYPFVTLVEKHSELQLCFRGNDYLDKIPLKGGKVCIYVYNHAMFTITPDKLYINPNYLRYCKDWRKIKEELLEEYGFNNGKDINPDVKKNKMYSSSFSNNQISVNLTKDFIKNKLNGLYELLKRVFNDFFSEEKDKCVDRFLKWNNDHNKKYINKIPPKDYENNKKKKLEKKRQQELFCIMQDQKDGYYFYDMEFQQKHKDKDELKAEIERGTSNKPDMQAIRFGKDGKPEAIVFVEVKCTKSAYSGEKSGLDKHVKAMLQYSEEELVRRRREAYMILHQYEKLGLRQFERKIDWREYTDLPLEIILVFTDEAIDIWKRKVDLGDIKFDWIQLDNNKLLPDGEKFEIVKVDKMHFDN